MGLPQYERLIDGATVPMPVEGMYRAERRVSAAPAVEEVPFPMDALPREVAQFVAAESARGAFDGFSPEPMHAVAEEERFYVEPLE